MKYTFKTKPYPHQRRALKRLLRQRGGGLQVQMRWGKTKVAIDFANCMHLKEGVTRVLVACPLSVVGVWEDEVPKHTPDELLGKIEWRIVNFESTYDRYRDEDDGTWFPIDNKELQEFNADLVIVDESHHIGNPNAVVSKSLYRLGRRARFRVIMTGTMFHRKPFYVFGQAKFYEPSLFGTSFSTFKKRIAVMGGYGGYEVLAYQNLKWMMKRMRSFVYIEKAVPPRPTAENVLHFRLTGKGLAYYNKMERESIIEVGGEEVISPIVLSKHLRCQQIAGGWVKTDTKYRRVGDDKYLIGADRIREYWEQDIDKFVVGCRFIPELRDAATAAKNAGNSGRKKEGYKIVLFHGGLTKDQRKARIKYFQNTKDRVAFISQISAGKEGIDLSAASVMLFWSLTESFVEFDQFRNRIVTYDEKRVLMYDFLVAMFTRDQVTYESILTKQDVAAFMATNPARVEEITAKRLPDTEQI